MTFVVVLNSNTKAAAQPLQPTDNSHKLQQAYYSTIKSLFIYLEILFRISLIISTNKNQQSNKSQSLSYFARLIGILILYVIVSVVIGLSLSIIIADLIKITIILLYCIGISFDLISKYKTRNDIYNDVSKSTINVPMIVLEQI